MSAATILFCDIVEFSQHPVEKQMETVMRLNAAVYHELYSILHSVDESSIPPVISLPTGDGIAVAFHHRQNSPSEIEPLVCLIMRLKRWAREESIALRIGVHCGPVSVIRDINHNLNICGNTINTCQRVMAAAAPNEVLLSEDAFHAYFGHRSTNRFTDKPFSEQRPAFFEPARTVAAKHGWNLHVFPMHLGEDHLDWSPPPQYGQVNLKGRIGRTRFIVKKLQSLLRKQPKNLSIYEQSAFSTFSVITEPVGMNTNDPDFDTTYLRLLKRQRELLNELIKLPSVTLKLIIFPVRSYDTMKQTVRFRNLLGWMKGEQVLKKQNLDFVIAQYFGPNRLIVANNFCIEGYKNNTALGYDSSIVFYNKDHINDSINQFSDEFEKAKRGGQTKQSVIKKIQALQKSQLKGLKPR